MNGKKNNVRKFALIMCFFVIAGLFAYYKFMSREPDVNSSNEPKTEIERLIAKDLDDGYPQTPKEVMNLYCRYIQNMYNNKVSDEEFKPLVEQLRKMYHSEFIAVNPLETQVKKLRTEIDSFLKGRIKITTCNVDPKVERRKYKGKQCTLTKVTFLFSGSEGYSKATESFILCKENDKWKIIGFKLNKDNETKIEGTK